MADAKQRNLMAAEFYGKEYVLFASGTLNNTEGALLCCCAALRCVLPACWACHLCRPSVALLCLRLCQSLPRSLPTMPPCSC